MHVIWLNGCYSKSEGPFPPVHGAGVMFENTEVVIEESATEEEELDDDMPEKVGSPYSALCCCCYII